MTLVKLDTIFDEGKYAEFVEGNQKKRISFTVYSQISRRGTGLSVHILNHRTFMWTLIFSGSFVKL